VAFFVLFSGIIAQSALFISIFYLSIQSSGP